MNSLRRPSSGSDTQGIEKGIEEPGVLDEAIRCLVRDQFENMCAQLREQGEGLIMACPLWKRRCSAAA